MKKITMIITMCLMILCDLSAETNSKKKNKIPWKFNFGLGFNLFKGNTERIGINNSVNIERISKIHEFVFKFNFYYGEAKREKDALKYDFTLKYDFNFLEKESFFIFVLPAYNEFQNLKLRLQNGIGYKHIFYKSKKSNYSLSGAVLHELKLYLDRSDNENIVRFSLRPKIKLYFNERGSLYFVTFYQPKLDKWTDYRILSELITEVNIYRKLFFEVKVIYEYNSIILGNVEPDDLSIITSIKLKL